MADWQTGCYYSYDKQYEANQLEVFYQMYEKVNKSGQLLYWLKFNWIPLLNTLQEQI